MPTVTVGNSAQELIPQNGQRVSLNFQNTDSSASVFIKKERPGNLTVSSTNFDFKIQPGGNWPLNQTLDGLESIQERWTAVSSTGNVLVGVFESENFKR